MNDWHHYVPFACLITQEHIPENRPATTRLIEQSVVGIIAAAIGSYVTLQVHAKEIETLKAQREEATQAIKDSEARVTQQIVEIRALLLKK